MTPTSREYFAKVRKTIIPRPPVRWEADILGQSGSVRAAAATIYGPNWYHDSATDLIEIWDAGPALCFKDVLPRKNKYAREGLYLRLSLAYRTTSNAFANIRTLSGNNVTLPNAVEGAMHEDSDTRFHVTDDCTININSIYREERLWLQRVDWEWASRETLFEDELETGDLYLERTRAEVEALYVEKEINDSTVTEFLLDKVRADPVFSKRCLLLLLEEKFLSKDLVALYETLNHGAERPQTQTTVPPKTAKTERRRRTSGKS